MQYGRERRRFEGGKEGSARGRGQRAAQLSRGPRLRAGALQAAGAGGQGQAIRGETDPFQQPFVYEAGSRESRGIKAAGGGRAAERRGRRRHGGNLGAGDAHILLLHHTTLLALHTALTLGWSHWLTTNTTRCGCSILPARPSRPPGAPLQSPRLACARHPRTLLRDHLIASDGRTVRKYCSCNQITLEITNSPADGPGGIGPVLLLGEACLPPPHLPSVRGGRPAPDHHGFDP